MKGEYIWGRTGIGAANSGAGVALDKTGRGYYALVTQNLGAVLQLAGRWESFTQDNALDVSSPTSAAVKTQNQVSAAAHYPLGASYELSVAWYHPLNGTKADAAPADPKADQWIAQAQAKF